MADKSNIEWTDSTWNPIRGCSPVSPGCAHCYAARDAARFGRPGNALDGLAESIPDGGARWRQEAGKPVIHFDPKTLQQPLSWRKARRVFVCSMSDLFHEDVPDGWISQVFSIMAACPQHTFQVLTKWAGRMRYFLSHWDSAPWPSQNVWLGVSCENQAMADDRIPKLLQTPAAVRFISAEPLLDSLDLTRWMEATYAGSNDYQPVQSPGINPIDWLIIGGESGPRARSMNPDWATNLVRQCKAANVACFVKQLGGFPDKRKTLSEWPDELRIRQYPQIRHAVIRSTHE